MGKVRRGERGEFGRLDDHRVTADECGGGLPCRDGDGEVPGGDEPDDAERLAPGGDGGVGEAAGKYFAGVGVAIFGGTASYLLVWLQSMNASWIFPVYVAVLSVLSIVFYVLARQKNGIFIGS
ncbi:hypothetical protein GCM10017710_21310 [Arthrobacter ramosus]